MKQAICYMCVSVHTIIKLSFILPMSTNITHLLIQIRGNKAQGKVLATRATLMTTLLELHCSSCQGRTRILPVIPIHLTCKMTQTFTRSCAAVIFQVGAVLPLVIFRAVTEIVHSKIEALSAILTWVWLTIVYVQLQAEREKREVFFCFK